MNKIAQKTFCSILFASLVTGQVSAMLSTIKKEKQIVSTIHRSTSTNNEQTLWVEEKKNKKTFSSLTPLKKTKDLTFSLFKKKKNEQKDEEDSEYTEKKKSRKNKILAVTATGVVIGFLHNNRKKFIPEIHAMDITNMSNEFPNIIKEVSKSENKSFFDGLYNLAKPEVIVPVLGAATGPQGAIYAIGTVLFTGIGWLLKNKSRKEINPAPYVPTEEDIIYFKALMDVNPEAAKAKFGDKFELICGIYGGYTPIYDGKKEFPLGILDQMPAPIGILNPTPNPEKPNLPNLPDVPTLKPEDYLPGVMVADDQTPGNNDTEEKTLGSLSDELTLDNFIALGGLIAKQVTMSVAIRALKETYISLWNSYDRNTQYKVNSLLNLKIAPKESPKNEWRIAKAYRLYNETMPKVGNVLADITVGSAEEIYKVLFKCMTWEWRSSKECYELHSDVIRYNIENTYKHQLSALKTVEDKIKYITDHKGIDEATKKASLEILDEIKKFNDGRKLELEDLNITVNNKDIPQDTKDRVLQRYEKNDNPPYTFKEEDNSYEPQPSGPITPIKSISSAVYQETCEVIRKFVDEY